MTPLLLLLAAQSAPVTAPAPVPLPPATRGKARSATPANYPGAWVTVRDYPKDALRDSKQGTTQFRLQIDAKGLVTGCEIVLSSGSASLDAKTCELMTERARFRPAMDARGKPTTGTYTNRVRWLLPDAVRAIPYSPGLLVKSFRIEPDGTISDCRTEIAEGDTAATNKLGPYECNVQPFGIGYRDDKDRPVTKRIRVTTKIEILDEPGTDKR